MWQSTPGHGRRRRSRPNWDERLTITVGPDKGDLIGRDDKVIQAAIDYVTRLGGGTVQLLPGTFTLRNASSCPHGLRLRGSGAETIITKIASETVALDGRFGLVRPGNHACRPGDGFASAMESCCGPRIHTTADRPSSNAR